MSKLDAQQSGGAPGSLGAGAAAPNSSDRLIETVMASVRELCGAESPTIAPKEETPNADQPTDQTAKTDITNITAPATIEASAAGATAINEKREAPRMPRELLTMPAGERTSQSRSFEPKQKARTPVDPPPARAGKGRFAATAAMVVLGVVAGAAGGALATMGVTHFAAPPPSSTPNGPLDTAVARIDADVVALRAGLEQTAKQAMNQYKGTSDRLDRIERAQAEPAAKLAKLSEAVDKLRAAPPPATLAAAATPKDVAAAMTPSAGAVAPPAQQAPTAPAAPARSEVGRLPTVEGWVLRDVGHGSALIEGRTGLYEVYAGDAVPGLGRVDAIRRQDGRWVVVTAKGLIVAH